jgi:hypothetical protein
MGGFLSSEPVIPLLQTSSHSNEAPSLATTLHRYGIAKRPQQAFDVFEQPRESPLDTVYEHDKEQEPVYEHPVEERDTVMGSIPNEVQNTNEKIYYNNVLEQIQDISQKEFYDLRRVGVQPIIVTDDIVLKRHRPSRRPSTKK